MDINKLKLGLSYIVFESEILDKITKNQVINYIETADIDQLKALALDGETHFELSENKRLDIQERFDSDKDLQNKLKKAALEGVVTLINIKQEKTLKE